MLNIKPNEMRNINNLTQLWDFIFKLLNVDVIFSFNHLLQI